MVVSFDYIWLFFWSLLYCIIARLYNIMFEITFCKKFFLWYKVTQIYSIFLTRIYYIRFQSKYWCWIYIVLIFDALVVQIFLYCITRILWLFFFIYNIKNHQLPHNTINKYFGISSLIFLCSKLSWIFKNCISVGNAFLDRSLTDMNHLDHTHSNATFVSVWNSLERM